MFDDADPVATAEGIAGAGYFNAGQDCTAATRVLAGPRVHEALLAALVEQAEDTTVGGTDNEDADYGPLNNANQLERVRGLRARRDPLRWRTALDRVQEHANTTVNLMPAIFEAVESCATVGEIAGSLRQVFGEHTSS